MALHKFQPGQSGNPSGRPKNVPDKRKLYNQYLTPNAPALFQKGLEMALGAGRENKEGTQILKLFLDRMLPKNDDSLLALGVLAGTLNQKSGKIFDLMSDGEISLNDGNDLMKALSQMQSIDMTQILGRLDKLDKAQENIAMIMQENTRLKAENEELKKK